MLCMIAHYQDITYEALGMPGSFHPTVQLSTETNMESSYSSKLIWATLVRDHARPVFTLQAKGNHSALTVNILVVL
jgi:hypothetical protein